MNQSVPAANIPSNKVKKIYVGMLVEYTASGTILPKTVLWEGGRTFNIDSILAAERKASVHTGGIGVCYTCVFGKSIRNLFHEENDRWFIEGKTS